MEKGLGIILDIIYLWNDIKEGVSRSNGAWIYSGLIVGKIKNGLMLK